MVTRALLCVAALAGCDRWREPEPLWQLDAHRSGDPERAPSMRAVAGLDGETIAIVESARLGNLELDGPHIVRISAAGAIIASRAVAGLSNAGPESVGIDAQGRAVAVWGGEAAAFILAFDANLEPRWNVLTNGVSFNACCTVMQGRFSIGPQGEVAFTTTDSSGNFTLHYLGSDGSERWTADARAADHLVIAETGDVLVYRYGFRVRFAAGDGSIIDEIAHPRASAAARDETAVVAALELSDITFHEPSGAVRWAASIPGFIHCPFGGCGPSIEDNALVMLAGDDVLVRVHEHEQVRLDGASGDRIGSMLHCEELGFAAADADGYLGIGRNCDGDRVLAKFPLPD